MKNTHETRPKQTNGDAKALFVLLFHAYIHKLKVSNINQNLANF
jgi:hypothetical protein